MLASETDEWGSLALELQLGELLKGLEAKTWRHRGEC